MTINVTITIDAPDAAAFAAEWARVIPLLNGADRPKDVVVDANDRIVVEAATAVDQDGVKTVLEPVDPPRKPRAKKVTAASIETTATSTVANDTPAQQPGPVQTDIEDAIAEKAEPAVEKSEPPPPEAFDIKAVRNVITKVFDAKGPEGAAELLKAVGCKNASGVLEAGKYADLKKKAEEMLGKAID